MQLDEGLRVPQRARSPPWVVSERFGGGSPRQWFFIPTAAQCLHPRPFALGEPGNSGGPKSMVRGSGGGVPMGLREGLAGPGWGRGRCAGPPAARLTRRITNPVISFIIAPPRCHCSQLYACSYPLRHIITPQQPQHGTLYCLITYPQTE